MKIDEIPPLTKILVPIDGSEHSKRAVTFTGCLTSHMKVRIEGITLLHVLAGHYLSEHMANIDTRVERLLETAQFQDLKKQYIDKQIAPLMDEARRELIRRGCTAEIQTEVLSGSPAEKIIEFSVRGGYSTIVIARRGLSEIKELLLGSVTASLLHWEHHPTLYVVGQKVLENETCPVPRLLIPVDGSPSSEAALEETIVMCSCCQPNIERLTLLHVVDLARYEEHLEKERLPEKEAEEILEKAKDRLVKAGMRPEVITTFSRYGDPAEIILNTAREQASNVIVMGKKGRSALANLLIGGVSSSVLHRSTEATVVLVSEAKKSED